MKRLGLFFYGALFATVFAHAADLGLTPQAAAGARGAGIPLGDFAFAQANESVPLRQSELPLTALTVIPTGGNGIIHSGPLNRAVPATWGGVSYNIVTGAFSDGATFSDGWDFNFSPDLDWGAADSFVLAFRTMANNESEYLVDPGGRALVLHNGDVVGPDALFSSEYSVPVDPIWLAGVDGVVGVRFNCDGRLIHAVAGGLCYGYIRIATNNITGFPARIIEAAFDGDAQPITVVTPVAINPPTATVTPASLAFSVAANVTSMQSLQIANASGSRPLQYAITAQGESAALVPHAANLAKAASGSSARAPWSVWPDREISPLLSFLRAQVRGHANGPWSTPAGIPYRLDDGSYEYVSGLDAMAGVWLNRFSVVDTQTINSVSVLWPRQPEGGSPVGLQANIVAYYDASGSGDPRNAVRLGGDHLVTIEQLDTFETYSTNFEVPGAGDIYVGFVEHWAMNGYPMELYTVAIDESSWEGRSYLSANLYGGAPPDINDLANNEFSGSMGAWWRDSGMLGNWLIRATGTNGACSGAAVPWLTTLTNGYDTTVVGGASTEVTVKVDPAAAGLAPGTYTAELCITSNDPTRPVIAVPLSLNVTAPLAAHSCSTIGDGIFCEGFEDMATDDIVRSGVLNLSLPRDDYGMSFNFARGEWSPDGFRGDDFYAYWSDVLLFYWYGDVVSGVNGGVAETILGPYRVLQAGDTVGPDSIFSEVADGSNGETANFLTGVDGYLGFKFYNEETRQTNYGYMRLITTWPSGFPATLVDYAYNRSGGPITIP